MDEGSHIEQACELLKPRRVPIFDDSGANDNTKGIGHGIALASGILACLAGSQSAKPNLQYTAPRPLRWPRPWQPPYSPALFIVVSCSFCSVQPMQSDLAPLLGTAHNAFSVSAAQRARASKQPWHRLITRLLQLSCLASAAWWLVQFLPAPQTPAAQLVQHTPAGSALDKSQLELALQTLLSTAAPSPLQAQGLDDTKVSTNNAEGMELLGIVAGTSSGGAALLRVGTEPARPYIPGAQVGAQWQLHSVNAHAVVLRGPRGALTLTMPDAFSPRPAHPSSMTHSNSPASITPHHATAAPANTSDAATPNAVVPAETSDSQRER